ncbi:MAG: type VII secretion protein EccE [Kineosporiaceae bacterium]
MTGRHRDEPGSDAVPSGLSSVLHGSRTLGHRRGLADEAADAVAADPAPAVAEATEAEATAGDSRAAPAVTAAPTIARRVAPARADAAATAVGAVRADRRAVLSMAQTRAAAGRRAASSGEVSPPDEGGDAPAPERPRPVLRRGTIGPLHVAQFVCWQAVALGVLVVLGRPPVTIAVVSTAATVVVLLSVVRVRGRVAAGWVWIALRFAARRTAAVATAGQEAPESLPSALLPGSVIGTLELDGERIGIIEHPRGVTVVFAPAPAPAPAPGDTDGVGPVRPLSPTALLRAVPSAGPPVTVQLLTLTTAAPPDDDEGLAARVYRGLRPSRPAYRGAWLALQVRRTADRWSDDDLAQSLGEMLRGVLRRLAKHGDRIVPLGPNDLAEVFAALTRIHGSGTVAEDWRAWQVPQESQVTYQVVRWPADDGTRTAEVLDSVALLPGAATVVSLAARRPGRPRPDTSPSAPGDLEIEVSLRICALPGVPLANACAAAVTAARNVGATLRRLDGSQRAGAIATSPFGGFSG